MNKEELKEMTPQDMGQGVAGLGMVRPGMAWLLRNEQETLIKGG